MEYPEEFRDPDVIREEMEESKEIANELDEEGEHLNAVATMMVYRTLRWVVGNGEERLEDELLKTDTLENDE